MSYAAVVHTFGPRGNFSDLGGSLGAFGAVCPRGLFAGRSLAKCDGGERASNCSSVCCEVSTFNNLTYRSLKGLTSWRLYNEKRTRAILQILLNATPSGGVNPIEEYAYDKGLAIPQRLMPRLRRAAMNYYTLFPANRWYTVKKCKPSECQADGYYSCFREEKITGTPERLSTVERMRGGLISSEQYAALPYSAVHSSDLPVAYKALVTKLLSVINSVPGSSDGEQNNTFFSPGANLESLVGVVNGAIVPKPWLKSFIAAFDPSIHVKTGSFKAKLTRSGAAKVLADMAKVTPRPGNAINPPRPGNAINPPPQDDEALTSSDGISALWIVGGVVAGIGGYLLLRNK